MVFLRRFTLLDENMEYQMICTMKNIHNTLYPFQIFPDKGLEKISFDPITIFYGGNGSGKTTILNIISEKLLAAKKNINDRGELFEAYVQNCTYDIENRGMCKEIKFISSDDVFDFLLDLRAINSSVNRRKEALANEYLQMKFDMNITSPLDQYELLKNKNDARRMTQSRYIRSRLTNNTLTQKSNGESALEFWEKEIQDHGIYILDEPENSLSAENQIKLKQFIEESARFFHCQFIISTHSPFLLAAKQARIYDLDASPVICKKWYELKNIRVYYEFFKNAKEDFE